MRTRPVAPSVSGRDVLVHRALTYGSDAELADGAVPYLRDGLRRGDAVVVITGPGNAALLRERLGAAAGPVEFVDSAAWFQAPVQTLAAYHEHARRDWWPRGRLRLLTEPVWAGRTPLEIREWKRHEAILNVAFAGTPSMICCAYDTRELPADVIEDAARTHPELVVRGAARPSPGYVDPADFYDECNAVPLPPPPREGVAERSFAGGGLPGLRDFTAAEAGRRGLPQERILPLVLAVNEVATNIIRHGGGRGRVRLWADGDELVCDVIDPARALRDRFLGYQPPQPSRPGAGMWAVRRLCHIVQIRSGDRGTVVRLHTRLH
ncbi:Anti-sigma regulatory factor (Ser/Thr protein kinase) [Thermomonospora echinospora]|uniref:Anti-sigma regulatory factor (Ser/Thr protein kinase) n=1 Tax=Thermomonospora echinospora TaxID=1992 RepID=A0A1H5VTV9_9ACTN|nr:sensor histidine kinase [Thermomonospora echinospora]SEF90281.1 Anti-sigma regulatory factor (Ser/Thr protein kinase) [Thermomonospora echinospora]